MPRYARSERRALVELMADLGPDAPTIDEGWTTRDLAAHLVVRERRPDAAAGILIRPLAGWTERVRRRTAARPYPRLLDEIRRPPPWSPVSNPLTDELTNLLEFFVHHEDVRRARPDWRPRELPAGLAAALYRRLPTLARMTLRRFPAEVLIQSPGHGEFPTGAGGERVRLVGTPGELTLFLFGRQRVARVQLTGEAGPVTRLRNAPMGI